MNLPNFFKIVMVSALLTFSMTLLIMDCVDGLYSKEHYDLVRR